VLAWQLASMVAWVAVSGMAARPAPGNSAASVFRAGLGALVLGAIAWRGARSLAPRTRSIATVAAICVGAALGPAWRGVGVDYFENVKGWLQEGSTLTLMGGLRGLATRLTLWLALLGGSLATGLGKHIHVDLVVRFLPKRAKAPIAVTTYLATAVVCASASWGFFDFNAIQAYDAPADAPASAKVSVALHEMGDHLFLLRKQIGLDLRSAPHVLRGEAYDSWMSIPDWNAWAKDAGFDAHFGPSSTAKVVVDGAGSHPTLVVSPTGKTTRGCLIADLNLVFPFGLLAIALRFVLRALLTAGRHPSVDPDAAAKEELAELSRGPAATEPPPAEGGA
jgi:hypothetical protein